MVCYVGPRLCPALAPSLCPPGDCLHHWSPRPPHGSPSSQDDVGRGKWAREARNGLRYFTTEMLQVLSTPHATHGQQIVLTFVCPEQCNSTLDIECNIYNIKMNILIAYKSNGRANQSGSTKPFPSCEIKMFHFNFTVWIHLCLDFYVLLKY